MPSNAENQSGQALTAEMLIRDMEALRGRSCRRCGVRFCHHESLMSMAMGFKSAPYCLNCLAQALDRDPRALFESLQSYIQQRECHRAAWQWAGNVEGTDALGTPSCLAQRMNSSPQDQ